MDTHQNKPTQHSIFRTIRVRKEDSAFVYFILESYEGITSYSTLHHKVGDASRDLELRIAPDFLNEVNELLTSLGEMVYELREEAKKD
jgi:hypothetical protein